MHISRACCMRAALLVVRLTFARPRPAYPCRLRIEIAMLPVRSQLISTGVYDLESQLSQ